MTISTEFGIGDEVYIVYKENGEVKIFKDEIKEILIRKKSNIVLCFNIV